LLPDWVQNIASVSSILGLGLTVWLLVEAKKIRNSFLRRARLPEVIKELSKANNKISKHLGNWSTEEREGIKQFTIAKELLESLQQKLPDIEKKKVTIYTQTLEIRRYFFLKSTISEATEDEAWKLYTGLSGIITSLNQLQKDSRWD